MEEYGNAIFGIGQYFGAKPDDERLQRFSKVLDLDRMHAAFEDGEIVGGAGAFSFDLSCRAARCHVRVSRSSASIRRIAAVVCCVR
jgi:hypothetical protein